MFTDITYDHTFSFKGCPTSSHAEFCNICSHEHLFQFFHLCAIKKASRQKVFFPIKIYSIIFCIVKKVSIFYNWSNCNHLLHIIRFRFLKYFLVFQGFLQELLKSKATRAIWDIAWNLY